ncbi:MAG: SiaC family regulatory phosphoprotein, partial [bacterium]
MVVIEKTTNTPELLIDSDEGNVELIGRCFPENAVAFFTKVKEKILEIEKEKMSIVFSLDYINTSSTKYLLNLLKELSEKYKTNIVWMYEY